MPKAISSKELKTRIKERKVALTEHKKMLTAFMSGKSEMEDATARGVFSTYIKVKNAMAKDVAKLEEVTE